MSPPTPSRDPESTAANPPAEDPSRAWLHRWQDHGDREALDSLLQVEVAELKRRLRSKGRTLMSESCSASDVANDAILKFLRRAEPPHFQDATQLRVYLWKAAWRLMIDRVRRPKLGRVPNDSSSNLRISQLAAKLGTHSAERREAKNAVTFAMQLLPEVDRQVLELTYFSGFDLGQVGDRIGISREAVAMRLVRARRKLSSKLRAWQDLIG
jgi:RNA polymerase sigma-70 factor (ECF subfamily)